MSTTAQPKPQPARAPVPATRKPPTEAPKTAPAAEPAEKPIEAPPKPAAKKESKKRVPATEAVAAMDGGKRDPPLVMADGIRAALTTDEKNPETRKVKRDLSSFVNQTLNGVARDLLAGALRDAHGRRLTHKMLAASITSRAYLHDDYDDKDYGDPKTTATDEDVNSDEDAKEGEDDFDGESVVEETHALVMKGPISSMLKQMAVAAQVTGEKYARLYKDHIAGQKAVRDSVRAEHAAELGPIGQRLPEGLGAKERREETLRRAKTMAKHLRPLLKGKRLTSQRAAEHLGLRVNLGNVVTLVRSVARDASRTLCAAVAGALDVLLTSMCIAIRRSTIKRTASKKKKEKADKPQGEEAKSENPKKKRKTATGASADGPCGLLSYEHFVTGLVRRRRHVREKATTVYQDGQKARRKITFDYSIQNGDLLRLVMGYMPLENHLLLAIDEDERVLQTYHGIDRDTRV